MHETVDFELINGKKVFVVLFEPDIGSKHLVIMNHGFRGSSVGASRSFVNFSRLLVKHGISVLRFDQPCSGNSEGDFVQSSFDEWVDTTAHLTKKYVNLGYQVALLGHSMGANAALVAAARPELIDTVPLLLLWAPDPKTDSTEWFMKDAKLIDEKNQIFEEGGQQFSASYWQEVLDADFFKCLDVYQGKIHLVYGENDRFVSKSLRNRVLNQISSKGQPAMILKEQDHMMWDQDACREVFDAELQLLKILFRNQKEI